MNKRIICFLFMLGSVGAWADGTITIKAPVVNVCNGPLCQQINNSQISLFILERISPRLEFKSWTGIVPTFWANSDNGILYQLNPKLKIGGEVSINHSFVPNFVSDYTAVRGIVEFKLW